MIKILVITLLILAIRYAQTYKRSTKKVKALKMADKPAIRRDFRGRFIPADFISWASIRKNNNLTY